MMRAGMRRLGTQEDKRTGSETGLIRQPFSVMTGSGKRLSGDSGEKEFMEEFYV